MSVWLSHGIRGVLFSISEDFDCTKNNRPQSKMGAVSRARLAFRVLTFTNKNICIDEHNLLVLKDAELGQYTSVRINVTDNINFIWVGGY